MSVSMSVIHENWIKSSQQVAENSDFEIICENVVKKPLLEFLSRKSLPFLDKRLQNCEKHNYIRKQDFIEK